MAKTHVNRQIVGNQGWIPTVIATNDQYHSYSLPQLTTMEFLKESGKPQAWFIAKFGTTKTVRSKTPSHMHTLKTNNLHNLHATGTNSQGQVTYNNITRSDYQRGENTSWTFTITKMINTLCGQDFNLKRVVVVLSTQCQRYKELMVCKDYENVAFEYSHYIAEALHCRKKYYEAWQCLVDEFADYPLLPLGSTGYMHTTTQK